MRKSRVQTAIGERMRQAALAAGLSAEDIAERLGCSDTTVYRWWSGDRRPKTDEVMDQYAAVVGCSADYLRWGTEKPMGLSGSGVEWALRWADMVEAGVDPDRIFDEITGGPTGPPQSPDIPEERLTEQERQILKDNAPAMRQDLIHRSAGRWRELTRQQKIDILRQIDEWASENARRGSE